MTFKRIPGAWCFSPTDQEVSHWFESCGYMAALRMRPICGLRAFSQRVRVNSEEPEKGWKRCGKCKRAKAAA